MFQQIPNIITLGNLFCGCCAFVCLLSGRPDLTPWFLFASFICDYGDGMAARALKVSSPLGKELDSLADVVSFGVVPGGMLYLMLATVLCQPENAAYPATGRALLLNFSPVCVAALPAFVLSMCAGMRLAKFNLDTRQTTYFIGLTTPACTVFILGLFLGVQWNLMGLRPFLLNPWLLYGLVPVLCYLMLSEIPMFGMKIKKLDFKSNFFNLIFAALFVLLVVFLKELSLSAAVLLYVGLSLAFKPSSEA